MKRALLTLLFLILCPLSSKAQLWSGVLSSSRAIDWSSVGVTGGIPSATWTQCGATISAPSSASAIQTALNNCGANQFVLLAAGSFTLSTGIIIPSHVVLRGAGPNQTTLNFSGQDTNDYYWGSFDIGFLGGYQGGFETHPPGMEGSLNCTGSIGPPSTYTGCTQLKSWTGTNGVSGTYTKGATTINLASAPSNLAVGGMLELTQTDDTTLPPASTGPIVGQKTSPTNGYSREGNGLTYDNTAMHQNVKVVSISGSAITVTPGIYSDFWLSSKNPVAYWWTNDTQKAGLENLTVNETFGDGGALWTALVAFHASDCWISGVVVKPHNGGVGAGNSTRHGILIHSSRNVTVQNSWIGPMFGGGDGSTTSYGLTDIQSSANLIQNNIFVNVESPIITTGGMSGDVFAYNYDPGVCTPTTGCTGIWLGHDEGGQFNLLEGNIGPLTRKDTFHGNEMFQTAFRNRLTGTEQNESTEPTVDLYAFSRYFNYVGNVLGTGTVATIYECEHNTGAGCDRFGTSIFRLGYPGEGANNSECGSPGCLVYDSQVKTTLMRWGNYDTVNAAVRFVNAEVPSGIPDHSNPVPANQNLPNSFYLSATTASSCGTGLSWWKTASGCPPFPPIGPDVTSGNISGVGGHANNTPAVICYNAASGLSANFNPATCYQSDAISGNPIVSISPSAISFPTTYLGLTANSSGITISNTGTATLNIASIFIGGANAADFSILSNTCPANLAVGNNCSVSFSFTPSISDVVRTATVSVTSNAPSSPDSASLSGIGSKRPALVSPIISGKM